MKSLRVSLAVAMAGVAGCAARQLAKVNDAAGDAPATTRPVDPKASLALDDIEPRVALPVPATRPSGFPPLAAIQAYAQARAALIDNQRYTAVNRLGAAAKLDPFSYEIFRDLGHAYEPTAGGTTNDKALEAMERAAAIRPDTLDLQYELGRQYIERADTPRALEHLRLARLTSGYKSERQADIAALVDFFLARALRQSGYTGAALAQYASLVKRLSVPMVTSRSDAELVYFVKHPHLLYAEIGELYEKLDRRPEALEAYELALASDPESTELTKRVIHASLDAGHAEQAKARSAAFVAKAHGSTESIELLKEIYRGANDPARLHRRAPQGSRRTPLRPLAVLRAARPVEGRRARR